MAGTVAPPGPAGGGNCVRFSKPTGAVTAGGFAKIPRGQWWDESFFGPFLPVKFFAKKNFAPPHLPQMAGPMAAMGTGREEKMWVHVPWIDPRSNLSRYGSHSPLGAGQFAAWPRPRRRKTVAVGRLFGIEHRRPGQGRRRKSPDGWEGWRWYRPPAFCTAAAPSYCPGHGKPKNLPRHRICNWPVPTRLQRRRTARRQGPIHRSGATETTHPVAGPPRPEPQLHRAKASNFSQLFSRLGVEGE